jgi:hypothetical protein
LSTEKFENLEFHNRSRKEEKSRGRGERGEGVEGEQKKGDRNSCSPFRAQRRRNSFHSRILIALLRTNLKGEGSGKVFFGRFKYRPSKIKSVGTEGFPRWIFEYSCKFHFNLLLSLFHSTRQATRLTQVNKRNGSPRDLRQNAVPLLDTLILNQDRADGTG